MPDIEKRLNYIDIYRQGRDHWRAKGNRIREASSVDALLLNVLAIAVRKFRSADEATDWLILQEVKDYLLQHLELLEGLVADLRDDKIGAPSVGGGYSHMALSAFAWAIGENEVGERYIRALEDERILELTSAFWREYHRAVTSLVDGKRYAAKELRTRGLETYWRVYLELVESLTTNGDIASALSRVDDAFTKRNADKRIKTDANEIEGSAMQPVIWDFRRDGLLAYADRAAG